MKGNVMEICNNLMAQEDYTKRNDKEWVINTLAEAYYGLDDKNNFESIISSRKKNRMILANQVLGSSLKN